MRIWSLHPKYLDPQGLVACWREGLLARHVLLGKTTGYVNHPQLIRFRELENPVVGIDTYLQAILAEAKKRNYQFDATKLTYYNNEIIIDVTSEQLNYEFEHLKRKFEVRNRCFLDVLSKVEDIKPHPLFRIIAGGIATWEK